MSVVTTTTSKKKKALVKNVVSYEKLVDLTYALRTDLSTQRWEVEWFWKWVRPREVDFIGGKFSTAASSGGGKTPTMCRKVVMVVTAKAKAVVDIGPKKKGIGQREMKDKDREGKR